MKIYKTSNTVLLILALLLSISSLYSQSKTNISIEALAYPTGIITGVSLDKSIGMKDFIHIKLAINNFDHRDLGVHDEETGSGYGFTMGYRRFFNESHTNWRWGIKSDLWFNKVDWISRDVHANDIVGETDIVVLQPTAELSYVFGSDNFIIAPILSFGIEWNIKTEGEPTGEGFILLVGVQLGMKF